MKISVTLTREEIEEAIFEYLDEREVIDTRKDDVKITFDIEPQCNSQDPRENTMGGLRSATLTEK